MYLIITKQTVTPDGYIFFFGVSWENYIKTSQGYDIVVDGAYYPIPKDNAIESTRFTRSENTALNDHQYNKKADKIGNYFPVVDALLGIDMKLNYSAQFKDGINPHRDIVVVATDQTTPPIIANQLPQDPNNPIFVTEDDFYSYLLELYNREKQ